MSRPQLKTLLNNLGGEARLREIVFDFYNRMSRDILIGFFFTGKDIEQIASRQSEFLLFAMGANLNYSGRPPQTAHFALPPILPGHFDRRLALLEQTLTDHKIQKNDIQAWLRFEKAFREIVITPNQN
jgi:truncated hemoglobin YjbI